jgi:hypothetical protein
MFREALGVSHDIDTGVDYYRSEFATTDMSGGLNEFVTGGGVLQGADGSWVFPTVVWPGRGLFGTNADGTRGLAPTLYKYFGHDGTAKSPDLGLYVNDQITLDKHWNLMFGLRYDKVDCIDTNGSTLLGSRNWSPRFVATFDPRGDSSKVFKFTFSRLASDYPQQLTSRFYTTARATGEHLVWTGLSGQKAIPADGGVSSATVGDYLKWATMAQLLDVANYGNPTAFYDNTKAWQIDPNLKPMTCNEYTVEFKRAYGNGSSVRMAYIYRKYSNMWATSRDYTPEYWQELKDTSGAKPALQSKLIQQTRVFNSDQLWRDYNGLELESYSKLNSVFSARFSYTYSRLHGNDNSLDGSSTQYYGDTNVTNLFNYASFNSASVSDRSPSGALRNDAPHRVRATLQAVLPVGKGGWISYAAVGRYDSGSNWDATAPATYGADLQAAHDAVQAVANGDPLHIAPNAIAVPTTWTKYYAERGAYHWNDSFQMDLTITWEIPVARGFKLVGALNVWNVFNHTLQTSYDATSDPNISSGTKYYLVDAGHFGGTRQDSFGNYSYWNSARSVTFNTGFKF